MVINEKIYVQKNICSHVHWG